MRTHPLALALLALAGCAGEAPTHRHPQASALPLDAHVYAVRAPIVDARYALARAALVGLEGEATEDGELFRVFDGERLVVVRKATGGFDLHDLVKDGNPSYAGPTMSEEQAIALATTFLVERALLPDGASLVSSRLIEATDVDGEVTSPNHWEVRYGLWVEAGVREDGTSVLAPVGGTVISVQVGDDEIIGLAWHVPSLIRDRTVPLYTPEEAAAIAESDTSAPLELGPPRLTYTFLPWGDPSPLLLPDYEYPHHAGHGHDVVRVPATPLEPYVRVLGATPVPAGEAVSLEASVIGGSAPLAYDWVISSAGQPRRSIGAGARLETTIPGDAEGLELVVTDALGLVVKQMVPVMYPMGGSPPLALKAGPWLTQSVLPPHWALAGQGWSMHLGKAGDDGLTLTNIRAGGVYQAVKWNLPSYFLDTFELNPETRCELTQSSPANEPCGSELLGVRCWNGTISTLWDSQSCDDPQNPVPLPWKTSAAFPEKALPGQPYFNRPFHDSSLVISATYLVQNIAPTTSCELLVTQTYIFEPMTEGVHNCGVGSKKPCFRFFPVVQYNYVDGADPALPCPDDKVSSFTIQQRFDSHQHMPGYKDLVSFVFDPDVTAFSNNEVEQPTEAIYTMARGETGSTYAHHGDDSKPHTIYMDNYHQRDAKNKVDVPGCDTDFKWTCYHVHWRWAGLAFALYDAPQHFGPPPPAALPFEVWPKVPGSQTVKVAAVLQRAVEQDPYDASWLADDEELGTVANGGRDIVQWVISESDCFKGKNGIGANSSQHYDQFNLNDWFFLEEGGLPLLPP